MRDDVVRSFWHGDNLNPYQLAGLRSFVARGYSVEVFSYQKLELPSWLILRDANDIWRTAEVLRYADGAGQGSPSLHSNRFRYATLHQLGGWWIDMDMVLLQAVLPAEDFFFAPQDDMFAVGALKFPLKHPLMEEAVSRFDPGRKNYHWGQTGPRLFNELVETFGLEKWGQSSSSTYPVHWSNVFALFDPDQREDVEKISSQSIFTHLSNEIWRRCGVPTGLAPPRGSWLEGLLEQYDMLNLFPASMSISDVRRWFENWEAGRKHQEDAINRASELEVALRQLDQRNLELNGAYQRIADFEQSTSWRLTEPIRRISKITRKLRE